ncbi:MAG: cyclic nucleotide-binding domain-containing protein [Chloroflexi bacterium]|nr:cyclic nucleotide-binding domain-containing protein [Chloroflexota bacterium]
MATSEWAGQIRNFPAVFYTRNTRTFGHLRSIHFRFSDTLNALGQDFVQLHDVAIQPLDSDAGKEIRAPGVILHKDSIVLGIPQEAPIGVERPLLRQDLRAERVRLPAIVEAWPFTIRGTLHRPPGVRLLQHIDDPHVRFLPVTDVAVDYRPNPQLSFTTPFLTVSRQSIELVLDLSPLGKDAPGVPDLVQPRVIDQQLSAQQAADVLTSTAVFKGVNRELLEQMCGEFCATGRLRRRLCLGSVEVFRQGDVGDTMYIVERGSLEVFVTDPRTETVTHLADYESGDFFGEMAILGEGRRTATVRAVTDASLIAIHGESVKQLMQRFPAATTNLLAIMVQRQARLRALR